LKHIKIPGEERGK